MVILLVWQPPFLSDLFLCPVMSNFKPVIDAQLLFKAQTVSEYPDYSKLKATYRPKPYVSLSGQPAYTSVIRK